MSEAKRAAIVLEADIQDRVAKLARYHKLSQGHIILTMLELCEGKPEFEQAVQARREAKVSNKVGKTAMLKELAKLSADDLDALMKALKKEA